MRYNISQFIAGISTVLFLLSIFQKENHKMFVISSVENVLNIAKNILLGAYSGAVVQVFGGLRSYSKAFNFFNGIFAYFVIFAQIILGIFANKNGYIGYLPILASVGYSVLLMRTEKNLIIKYGLSANLVLWAIYNLSFWDFVGAFTNLAYAIITLGIAIKQSKSTSFD